MHRRCIAIASLTAALLMGACSSEAPGGQEQQGPNTSLEQNNPNAGRPGVQDAPDAGSNQQGDAPASGGAAGSGG